MRPDYCPVGNEPCQSLCDKPCTATPKRQPLTNTQIEAIGHRKAWRYKKSSDPHHSDTFTFNRHTLVDFARSIVTASGQIKTGFCKLKAQPGGCPMHNLQCGWPDCDKGE